MNKTDKKLTKKLKNGLKSLLLALHCAIKSKYLIIIKEMCKKMKRRQEKWIKIVLKRCKKRTNIHVFKKSKPIIKQTKHKMTSNKLFIFSCKH